MWCNFHKMICSGAYFVYVANVMSNTVNSCIYLIPDMRDVGVWTTPLMSDIESNLLYRVTLD